MGGTGSGRRPAPLEQRRARGRTEGHDSGGRKLPDAPVVLSSAEGRVPEPPAWLGPAGESRWTRLWRDAGTWLSSGTDWDLLVRLCEAEDTRVGMREALAEQGWYVSGSTGQVRPNPMIDKLRLHDAEILRMERECGLTPSARGALGVGEVVAQQADDPLTAILKQHAARGARRGSA